MDTAWTLPDRPMSITEIAEQADKFQFNALIPLKSWLRASDTLLRQVLGISHYAFPLPLSPSTNPLHLS